MKRLHAPWCVEWSFRELCAAACRCSMQPREDGSAEVMLEGNDQGLAAGQYACFYQDGICLGAAVILGQARVSGSMDAPD